jgi:predicted ATPase
VGRLAGLVCKELIRPHPPIFQVDQAFRFRHLLIRDAAYDAVPKATRAELHGRFAHWLEGNAQEPTEFDEIVGWHLEQTIRYQQDLRRSPDPMLWRRAAQHLHSAGRRAAHRGDLAATRNLLERALALAADDAALSAQIAVDLAEGLIEAGDLARADALLTLAEQSPDVAGLALLLRLEWRIWAQPEDVSQTVEATPRAA